ncbi:MAG TPA: hypothetical protein VIM07_06850 [Chitinophagaceae bacterium]
MKKYILIFLVVIYAVACNTKDSTKATSSASTIKLPYEATYATEFTNDVPDSSLLLALNTYKYWENNDMKGLRSTMGDSIYVNAPDGFTFKGRADSIIKIWTGARDTMTSVKIIMDVWLKNHSVKDSMDYINTWYKEIDTYKSGRVDSAYYEDDNGLKNGKIIWYSSHKQVLK